MTFLSRSNNHGRLSINEVESSFFYLLRSNGQTSSLEVKHDLRKQGYWAKQDEVASIIRNIAANHHINSIFNGTYRVYTEDQNNSIRDDQHNRSRLTFKIIRQRNQPITNWNSGNFKAEQIDSF